jgi:glycosyltransferase involved in cell wall biosynthesis
MLGPVDLAYVSLSGQEPAPEYAAIDGLQFHPINPSRGLRRAASYAASRARGVPDATARAISPELISQAERMASEPGLGRVVVGDPSAASALLRTAGRRPVTYNAHNVGPINFGLSEPLRRPTRALANAYERRLLGAASESWMVSRHDMHQAQQLVPGARLRYVPNVVDVAAISPVDGLGPPPHRLLMVADFDYEPNRKGREWLVTEIMPLVWRDIPDARLALAGRESGQWRAPDSRIDILGFVADLHAAYAQAGCVVVPITTGGGTPLKFVEALAHGVPVVATGFAARGLDVVAGEHYIGSDDAGSFADAIVRVLRDGAPELAAAGRRLTEEHYSVAALAQLIAA